MKLILVVASCTIYMCMHDHLFIYTCALHHIATLLSHKQGVSIEYVLHPNQQTFLVLLSIFITATLLCVCTTQISLYSLHTFQVRLFNLQSPLLAQSLQARNLHYSPTDIVDPAYMARLQHGEHTFCDFSTPVNSNLIT